jgi:hypothetical protein
MEKPTTIMGMMGMIPLLLLVSLTTAFVAPSPRRLVPPAHHQLVHQRKQPFSSGSSSSSSSSSSTRLYQDSMVGQWWKEQQEQQLGDDLLVSSGGTATAVLSKPSTSTSIPNFWAAARHSVVHRREHDHRYEQQQVRYKNKHGDRASSTTTTIGTEEATMTSSSSFFELGTFEFSDDHSDGSRDDDDDDQQQQQQQQQPVVPQQQQQQQDNTTRPSSSTSATSNETKQQQNRAVAVVDDDNVDESNIIFSRRHNGTKTPAAKSKIATGVTATTTATSMRIKKSALVLPSKLQSTDVVTVADLETILLSNGLLTSSPASATKTRPSQAKPQGPQSNARVAFPQPSMVSAEAVRYGSTAAASVLGLLIGASVLTNLWLIGGLLGGYYGYIISPEVGPQTTAISRNNNNNDDDDDDEETQNPLAVLVTFLGTRLARFVLWWHDAIVSVLFLFKTGQLSYQYYKAYAVMDRTWGVQSKIDAWNAKFVEGKLKFDAWERQNEIGRKTLALLRTVTFVEEKQRRRYKKGLVTFGQRAWKQMQGIDHLILAVASALATGIVWTVLSPPVAMILTLALGAVWPTWLAEWIRLLRQSRVLSTITIRSVSSLTRTQKLNQQRQRRRPTEVVDRRDLTFGWFGQLLQRQRQQQQQQARRAGPRRSPPRINYYRSSIDGRRRYDRPGCSVRWPWQQRNNERRPPPPRWKFWLR